MMGKRRYLPSGGLFRSNEDSEWWSQSAHFFGCLEGSQKDELVSRHSFARSARNAAESVTEVAAWNAWVLVEKRNGQTPLTRKYSFRLLRIDPGHASLIETFDMLEGTRGKMAQGNQRFTEQTHLNHSSHRSRNPSAGSEASQTYFLRARFLFENAFSNAEGGDGTNDSSPYLRLRNINNPWTWARYNFCEGLRNAKELATILHALWILD
ncbi:hypothetical protein FGB62_128g119 [Gracilaria domingensis]|nr:hypothetical protein FGB62_128g119 [Gracilaria domingensis]